MQRDEGRRSHRLFARVGIILASLVVLVIAGFLSVNYIRPFELRSLLRPSDPVRVAYEHYLEKFDDRLTITGLATFPQSIVHTPLLYEANEFFDQQLYTVPGIADTDTLTSVEMFSVDQTKIKFHSLFAEKILTPEGLSALELPPFERAFLAKSGDSFLVHVKLDKRLDISAQDNIAALLLALAPKFSTAFPGAKLHWLGYPVARHHYTEELKRSQTMVTGVVVALVWLMFLVMFRSWRLASISLLFVLLCYAANLSFILWYESGMSPYSSFALTFVFIIATADVVHFISKLSTASASTLDERLAYVHKSLFKPCFLTGLTTVVGFISLLFSTSLAVKNLGIFCTFGVTLCFLATFYLLPWVIRVFVPHPPLVKPLFILRITRYPRILLRWRIPILAFCTIGCTLFAFPALKLDIDDSYYEKFAGTHPLTEAAHAFQDKMGYLSSIDISLTLNPGMTLEERMAQMARLTDILNSVSGVVFTRSSYSFYSAIDRRAPPSIAERSSVVHAIFDLLERHDVLDQFQRDDGAMRIEVYADSFKGRPLADISRRISEVLNLPATKLHMQAELAGFWTVRSHIVKSLKSDLLNSFLFSYITIFFIFVVVLRSIPWALMAMVPNILPLFVLAGTMSMMGITVDDNLVILLNVVLGIVVDDTMHFISVFRDRMRSSQQSALEILDSTLTDTSPGLLGMTLCFLITVPAFALMELVLFKQIAIFLCFTLTFALLLDFFMTPLMMPGVRLPKQVHRGPVRGGV